eukprot:scaffold6143_cov147-Skeletonema_dohrnii-CCMP3373.AAC.15
MAFVANEGEGEFKYWAFHCELLVVVTTKSPPPKIRLYRNFNFKRVSLSYHSSALKQKKKFWWQRLDAIVETTNGKTFGIEVDGPYISLHFMGVEADLHWAAQF